MEKNWRASLRVIGQHRLLFQGNRNANVAIVKIKGNPFPGRVSGYSEGNERNRVNSPSFIQNKHSLGLAKLNITRFSFKRFSLYKVAKVSLSIHYDINYIIITNACDLSENTYSVAYFIFFNLI